MKFVEFSKDLRQKAPSFKMDMDVDYNINETIFRKRKRDIEDDIERIIGYVYDENLVEQASKLPNANGRAEVVQRLIEAYGLMRNVTVYENIPATEEELCNFHSSDYITYLKDINYKYTPEDDVELDYGLGYDCPPLDGIFDYCSAIGGSTITAARALVRKEVDVAINWFGGWHHAERYEASGFCYINDIVLGILELRSCYNQILYIDLDVHHGNGVEQCFEMTKTVFTLSIHLYEPGFFPGSGPITDIGSSVGRYTCLNVPLKEGITDKNYCSIFDQVLYSVVQSYSADAIVVQCGADGLSGDPLGGFSLTEKAYGHCLQKVLNLKKPTLILGGGGYNITNTSRCWTYLTSVIIGTELSSDIPEHDHFLLYGPSFELSITPGNRKDLNNEKYVQNVLNIVKDNLELLFRRRIEV